MTPENSDASGPAMTIGRVSRAVIEGQALSRGRDAPKGGRSVRTAHRTNARGDICRGPPPKGPRVPNIANIGPPGPD